jgi:hypothetical protein
MRIHLSRVVDPDSVTLWIRIRIQGQENKEISEEKCTFLLFKKNVPLPVLLKKKLMNNTGIFDLISLKFDFKKICEGNCLRKFCFSLDPDPD